MVLLTKLSLIGLVIIGTVIIGGIFIVVALFLIIRALETGGKKRE